MERGWYIICDDQEIFWQDDIHLGREQNKVSHAAVWEGGGGAVPGKGKCKGPEVEGADCA